MYMVQRYNNIILLSRKAVHLKWALPALGDFVAGKFGRTHLTSLSIRSGSRNYSKLLRAQFIVWFKPEGAVIPMLASGR